MNKHLFGMALFLCLVISGAAFAQTIDDIQWYDPLTGDPLPGQEPPPGFNTDLLNVNVTVTGTVVELHQYSSGSAHIVDATGEGISIYHGTNPFPAVLGDEIEIGGTIGVFRGGIQIGGSTTVVKTENTPVVPIPAWTIADLHTTFENVGKMAAVIGTVTRIDYTPLPSSSNFTLTDGPDTVYIYIDNTTEIDISGMTVGQLYQITSPIIIDNGLIELKPRFDSDLVLNPGGDTLPVISDVDSDNWTPEASDPVTMSATITDDNGINSALVFYRDSDGVTPGGWSSVAMSDQGGDIWAGMIPGGHSSTQIDYYIQATDTGDQTVTRPGSAPDGFLSVAVGFTPIWDVTYAHPDSTSQSAAMDGQFVNIRGIVTAGTNHVGSPTKFIVQEPGVNPDTDDFKFSGILVYETSALSEYFPHDEVAIGGLCDEYFGLTEMIPHNGTAIYLLSFGNDLPGPAKVPTRTLADDSPADVDGDGIMGEAWESVWVQTYPAAVMDTLGFGEYIVADNSARTDSLVVDPLVQLSYAGTIGDVLKITSYMDYAFGRREIIPIADEYIIQTGLTAVDDTPTIQPAGGFHSVAPNPFNPRANIKFVVNRDNLVQLNVYNIRGEKVRTIVQDRLPANTYDVVWDGTNDAGQNVASGTYYARLRIGAEVVQVRPMTLLK